MRINVNDKVVVAQLGARMHYAVPRILHEAGMLQRLYTDICAVKGWPRWLQSIPEALRPAGLSRLLGRVPEGVPRERITALTTFGAQYFWRRRGASCPSETTAAHLWAGSTFCQHIIEAGFDCADSVYTFNSAGLEILRFARRNGLKGIVEQTIAPRRYETKLLQEEHARHPEWAGLPLEDHLLPQFFNREESEWQEADLIVCGSSFVREGIRRCNGPVDNCVVVPYGVDARFAVPDRQAHDGPLRVLVVGTVGLRKGSPYVLEAAERCGSRATFRMVGHVDASKEAEARLREHVNVRGRVARTEMPSEYAWADVFLLPSICEGSATVTYEALAAGLPVICTPNTGSIVRDGEEGFIVPIRDAEAITERLLQLAESADLRRTMGRSARQRYEQEGSLAAYSRRLLQALDIESNVRQERKKTGTP